MVDRIAAIVPRHATYLMVRDPALDPDLSGVFRVWALTSLLPRVVVRNPDDAQWVVALGKRPEAFGLKARDARAVRATHGSRLVAWVGRTAR
jgi:hypothetical protein